MTMISRSIVAVSVTAAFLLTGCGGEVYTVVPVSGKVTSNGSPVVGIQVIFAPHAVEENFAVGPWSTGITNSAGEFMLETRYKENGAVVGMHDVCFEYPDVSIEDLEELQEDLEDARDEEEGSPDEITEIVNQMEEIRRKLQSRPWVAEEYSVEFEVPADGSRSANFDLPAN